MTKSIQISLNKQKIEGLSGECLVVFSLDRSEKDQVAKISSQGLEKRLKSSLDNKVITGKKAEVIFFRELHFEKFDHVLVVGLGESSDFSEELVRQTMGTLQSHLMTHQIKEAYVQFDGINSGNKHLAACVQAAVEGLSLASYEFDELKTKTEEKKKEKKSPLAVHLVTSKAEDSKVKTAFHTGQVLAECVNFSRRLGDLPGNLMTPSILASEVQSAAKGTGIKVTIWNKEKIVKEKMGGLYSVSKGSTQEPRFIIMEYKPAGAPKKPMVYVGKGLTFDSGGISIKPSASMEEMKYDMCGGANVIGSLLAMAKLKLKVHAIALVPATENMPGPDANKPGDIITARNGKTFEVNNTDAEGRLILSDALAYACELKPEFIVDAATLTGAIVVALGNLHTAYFTKNTKLKSKIESAASSSGEWVWNMPLCDFHTKDMKGTFADLSNISSSKGAGSSTAAAFLEQFVEKDIPWAHFDIAGTAWAVGGRLPYCSKKGASGVMVRTFVALAQEWSGKN